MNLIESNRTRTYYWGGLEWVFITIRVDNFQFKFKVRQDVRTEISEVSVIRNAIHAESIN